jgi:hypothetical protein
MSNSYPSMEKESKTILATEKDLYLEQDVHRFDEVEHVLSEPHPVRVDGIKGTAAVGSLGGYSTRIRILLEKEHPDLGKEFQTKYFKFIKPGVCLWGHDEKTFTIEKFIDA